MKKIILIFLLLALVLVSGCLKKEGCIKKEEGCCKGSLCADAEVSCPEGASPKFLSCDEKCMPKYSCEKQISSSDYTLTAAEGSCTKTEDCVYAGDSCGGGHGICTNTPEKYEGLMTTCEIIPSHPSNNGYSCDCIASLNKCGWVKNSDSCNRVDALNECG